MSSTSNPILKVGRMNHVAIATPDLAASAAMYRDIFRAKVSEPVVSFDLL